MSELHEECGVVGVMGDPEAAHLAYLALYALQHRGQEASGIVTFDDRGYFHSHKNFGLVKDVFTKESFDKLAGQAAVGHNRYSTHGGKLMQNIQPFSFRSAMGRIAIAQNGNLTNATSLKAQLEGEGAIFHSTSDTEVIIHLLARATGQTILERIFQTLPIIKGAYSLIILTKDRLFAARDPHGFRPLVMGRRGQAHVVTSETCALDLIDARFEREVEPGEVVEIDSAGTVISHKPFAQRSLGFCSFEPIYFSRPDSKVFGSQVYSIRHRIGEILAEETAVEADVVVAVPDSGTPMAMGFARHAGLPMELGLVRNHYIGRTFIEPSQEIRDFGVKLKLNPVPSVLMGKRVIVVDDSLVRGTTSLKILRMIREAGAKEIHFRLGSPPITHSCYFGVDTPERDNLLAAQANVEKMRDIIGADSLAFLSPEGLRRALGADHPRYCYGCFSGSYPEDICTNITEQPTDRQGGPGLQSRC